MEPRNEKYRQFQKKIWNFYHKNKREFPWRETFDPYRIVVSEVMLQQTQAGRVVSKYNSFIKKFPNWKALGAASLSALLKEWQGLGYNRRALNLRKLGGEIIHKYNGKLPENPEALDALPGIGKATAGSIYVFTYDRPAVFIETNIRRVFIHFFFPRSKSVPDEKIERMLKDTLPRKHFREWYYALMDYGAMLKKEVVNPNRRSKHYTKQSPFKGSNREIRGAIVKFITKNGKISKKDFKKIPFEKEKIQANILVLKREGFFEK